MFVGSYPLGYVKMESKKTNEALDESTYLLGSNRGTAGKPGSPTSRKLSSEVGKPLLWQSPAVKNSGNGQWPLGTDRYIEPTTKQV